MIGANAKSYRLTTGSRASWGAADTNGFASGAAPGSLSEITTILGDITVNNPNSNVQLGLRGGGGWWQNDYGLDDMSVDMTLKYTDTDAHYLALMSARINKTTVAIAFLSGSSSTSGAKGFWADWKVEDVKKAEPINGEQAVTFTLKPGVSSIAPQWVAVP